MPENGGLNMANKGGSYVMKDGERVLVQRTKPAPSAAEKRAQLEREAGVAKPGLKKPKVKSEAGEES